MNTYADLDQAEQYLTLLADLLSTVNGGHKSDRVLAQVRFLCREANRALRDLIWQDHLEDTKTFASALYSDLEHLQWAKRNRTGVEHLRLQLMKTLNALTTRLTVLRANREIRFRTVTAAVAGA
jgi:hypothetical protein